MSASKGTLHERLRQSTRAAHEELERAVRIGERISTRAGYVAHLEQLWALHSAVERALDRFDFAPFGFMYRWPNRSALLEADLATLGVPKARLTSLRLPEAPRLDGISGALGSLYVVEGSAKGARAILPAIRNSLALDATSGASFFGGFGPETKTSLAVLHRRDQLYRPRVGLWRPRRRGRRCHLCHVPLWSCAVRRRICVARARMWSCSCHDSHHGQRDRDTRHSQECRLLELRPRACAVPRGHPAAWRVACGRGAGLRDPAGERQLSGPARAPSRGRARPEHRRAVRRRCIKAARSASSHAA